MTDHTVQAEASERTVSQGAYRNLLGAAWQVVRRGGWRLASVYLVGQLIVAVIAAPVLHWLFAEALRAAGLSGVEIAALPRLIEAPLSAGLILIVVIVGFLVLSLQFLVLVVAVQRVQAGERLLSRDALTHVASLARKLLRPSSLALLPYLFLLLPLGGIGFLSVLSQAITIPSFISGELVKTTAGMIGYLVFLLVLLTLNVRFALAVPLFAMTDATGGRAQRRSWRLMRGHGITLTLLVATVLIAGALAGAVLVAVGLAPVALTDMFAPSASPAVAAVMLALTQACALTIIGMGGVMIVSIVVTLTRIVVPDASRVSDAEAAAVADSEKEQPQPRRALIAVLCAAALIAGLSVVNLPLMNALSRAPDTLVIAHRGYTAEAVENTLSSLEAAREVGADFVEMDVMETADRQFVVMHDANLSRLADHDSAVSELTLDELSALTVHDTQGNSDRIPSLEEYVLVAKDIEQPLLIEIKLHGAETPDLVPRLVQELESLGVLEDNIYHSLDGPTVEELKRVRPNLTVGLTMALAGMGVPQTSADFLVMEEWSFTDEMRDAAHAAGLGAMAWTVNDEQRIRDLMRDDIDGVITDVAAEALDARTQMQQSTGLADVFFDAIMRYIVIF
ncbi:glycerophosphoryl diester phosphodiesterase membrane domain-containing protein [Microbacterium sp. A82]|uniref:glycerophosphoryl diester phosphodiesterase membrane domain-containing protein n=1 Tax=Microbacterium sp. A82 TaxID=3450452 RepID=UPI003F39089E